MMKILENICLALLGTTAKLLFLLYRALLIFVIAGLSIGLVELGLDKKIPLVDWLYPLAFIALILLFATARSASPKDNPYRQYVGLGGFLDACIDRFIAWIGTLKYFTSPICLVEDPGSYKIKGPEIRELIDGTLQPGDILLRGYNGYLDGVMIRSSANATGLGRYFSHAALYLGDLTDTDQSIVANQLEVVDASGQWQPASEDDKNTVRNNPEYFHRGRQMVVHAMTKGVFVEDILTFLRCDYLVVLRLHDTLHLNREEMTEDKSLITKMSAEADTLHTRLLQGGVVNKQEVINVMINAALGRIGSCYDFQFNNIKQYHSFSCSEFIYYCCTSVQCYLGLKPQMRGFLNLFFRRETITPSDIYEVADSHKKLAVVWTSQSLQENNTEVAQN